MSAQAPLKLNLLGSIWMGRNGVAVDAIESDKARALLIYLAVESDRAHSRQMLATLLWPNAEGRVALQNLRQALYNLRQAIGDPSAARPQLASTRYDIYFEGAAPRQIDVSDFRGYLEAVKRHPHSRVADCITCAAWLRAASELYRGEFLSGFSLPDCDEFESWLQDQREQLRAQALDALAHLAAHHVQRREYELAEGYYRRQVEIAPWHEEGQRGIMSMLALRGQTAAAIHHYSILEAAVAREFGTSPLPESRALLAKIQAGQIQPEPEAATNPYKGLQSFAQADAERFFGRAGLARQLLALLYQQPFCALIGASGSGKSSVIHAGLLPMLAAEGFEQQAGSGPAPAGANEWLPISFRPGQAPFQTLAAALAPHLPPSARHAPETLAERLRNDKDGLWQCAQTITEPHLDPRRGARSPAKLLIVVDQFEELYTLCPDSAERQDFIDLLLAPAARQLSPASAPLPAGAVRVLTSLRADFTGQAISYRPLADAIQSGGQVLGPMNSDELRQAIVEPARRQGVSFEAGLVERLLGDIANEPGNLLLLQFTLTLLWEKRANGLLSHADYEETGGVAGALARYADSVVEAMDASERERVRRLFLRMVQPGDGAPDTRRTVARTALSAEDWGLVQRLADARLLVTDRRQQQEVAEVAHEALIRNWEQLRSWLEADRQFQLWHFQLQAAAERWLESERDPNLLLRGRPLIQAETWMGERDQELSPDERMYIEAGASERDRRASEDEEQRQRELAQALALAHFEHERAETRTRTTGRLRLLRSLAKIIYTMA